MARMKAGHYCFPCAKYLKYSLHMEGKTAQKKTAMATNLHMIPRVSEVLPCVARVPPSAFQYVPILGTDLQFFTARIPMWAAHLPPASASRGPWPAVVAAPVRRHRSLRRSWRRWVPPSGRARKVQLIGWWGNVEQCGASTESTAISSISIYLPW